MPSARGPQRSYAATIQLHPADRGSSALSGALPGRIYYQRKRSEGKGHKEAMRCLKRRLSDLVYRQLTRDADQFEAGPGGHLGAALSSRATG
jgi:hypothetical protein